MAIDPPPDHPERGGLPDRPLGMLPRGAALREAKPEDVEWALDLAESFFEGCNDITDLSDQNRALWIILSTKVLRGSHDLEPFIAKLSEIFKPGVDVQIEDTLLRQNAHLEDQRTRLLFDALAKVNENERADELAREERLNRQRKRKIEDEERELKWKKWELREKERLTWLGNNSWRERIGLSMAVLGFLIALVICVFGLANQQGLTAGASGAFCLSVLGLTLRHVLRREKPAVVPPSPSERKPE